MWADNPGGENGIENSGVKVKVGTKTPPTANASSKGSVGSGTEAPETQASWSAKVKDHAGGSMVYKPLADIIDSAIELARTRGFKPITVTSTYRSPQKQRDMKLNPGKHGVAKKKNGEFVEVGEAWGSSHQYGYAVDVSIQGDIYSDYQEFATLCNQVAAEKGTPGRILWGGTAYNNDRVHYEWRLPAGSSANEYRKAKGYTEDTAGTAYLADVWSHFEAASGTVGLGTQPSVPPSAETLDPNLTSRGSGITNVADTAEPCVPAYLTAHDTGLAQARELADKIAKLMRS
jgi:hypothetical protein